MATRQLDTPAKRRYRHRRERDRHRRARLRSATIIGSGALLAADRLHPALHPLSFYWAIVSSVTPDSQLLRHAGDLLAERSIWSHYEYVFENGDFLKALRNSAIVSVGTVMLALALGSLGAYALGRMRFRGRTFALYLDPLDDDVPGDRDPRLALPDDPRRLVPQHAESSTTRCSALIFTYLTFTLPFTVWVLTNFFKAMPGELEEAALVDGATPMRAFWQILLPLALPGLVTTGLLAFIAAWNEFLFALTFTQLRSPHRARWRSPVRRQHPVRAAVRQIGWPPRSW